jgi:adenylosuccinate synthase
MPVDVIIGGQGGDEGKGKIAEYLGLKRDYKIAMRVPSPQAGHSIMMNGQRVGLANLPTSVKNEDIRLLIGIGGLVSLERLLYGEVSAQGKESPAEITATGIGPGRLGIDYETRVVSQSNRDSEQANAHLMGKIGSIGSGTSGCRMDTIMRVPLLRAKDYEDLNPYLTNTKEEIYAVLEKGGNIVLEGDHGAKLDPIHSGEYPYVTTRNVNAASFISDSGIAPNQVRDVYVILKPYTTRVADGPLEGEVLDNPKVYDWALNTGGESGSVSGRERRIGAFEWENVADVIKMNGATKLAISHMDAPDFVWNSIGYKNEAQFLDDVQGKLCNNWPYPKIELLSYGPGLDEVVEYSK